VALDLVRPGRDRDRGDHGGELMRARTSSAALLVVALASACGSRGLRGILSSSRATALENGKRHEDELELPDESARVYVVEVPEGAVSLRAKLLCPDTDLALRARAGRPPEPGEDTASSADETLSAASESGEASLVVDRFSDPPLAPGPWYLEVAWDRAYAPRTADRRLKKIPFSIEAHFFEKRVDGRLGPGELQPGVIDSDSGGWRTYTVEVPEGAPALRIDLTDVDSDLDLYARKNGAPGASASEEGEAFSQHFYGRETLRITRETDPPISAGTWYVDVVDSVEEDRPSPFRIVASLSDDPPAALLVIPPMPGPDATKTGARSPIARALVGVVELANDAGVGSGTILTSDGLVLTNEHVVAALGGTESDDLVVSVPFDPHRPPVETFRAKIVRTDRDRDLALVRITSGFYGQALPADYRFQPVALGEPGLLAIGDTMWLVGYPTTGGQGSRVTISATRGVVSGFDESAFGTVIKTDAEITNGNSGGAALDAEGRIVGVPTSTVEHGGGHIGYVHPLTLIPPEWRALIEKGRER
jgi:S1-C subfamily serine protease